MFTRISLLSLLLFGLVSCTDLPNDIPENGAVHSAMDSAPALARSSSATISKYYTRGEGANFSWYDGSRNIQGYVFVTQDRPKDSSTRTYLYYQVYVNGQRVEGGFGYIANEDFTGSFSSGKMELNTDTSTNSNFTITDGSGGQISLSWRETDAYEYDFAGTTHYSSRRYRYKYTTRGNETNVSATGSGQVVGYTPSGSKSGSLRKFNNFQITFYPSN